MRFVFEYNATSCGSIALILNILIDKCTNKGRKLSATVNHLETAKVHIKSFFCDCFAHLRNNQQHVQTREIAIEESSGKK